MQNSFIFEFESWVPLWCVSVDAHSGSHFYNNETSMDVSVAISSASNLSDLVFSVYNFW